MKIRICKWKRFAAPLFCLLVLLISCHQIPRKKNSDNTIEIKQKLIYHIPYHPGLTFDSLQSIRQELLRDGALSVMISGISSSKIQLVLDSKKLYTYDISVRDVLEQLGDTLLTDGLIITLVQKNILEISFRDCLYSFNNEIQVLNSLAFENSQLERIPIYEITKMHMAIDEGHPPVNNAHGDPMIEIQILYANEGDENAIYKSLAEHFGAVYRVDSLTSPQVR